MNKTLNRIKSLTIKEFQNLWVDKRITAMLLLSPVIQLLIFAWAVTLEVKNVSMIIFDKDNTEYSRELSMRFNNDSIIKEVIFVNNYKDMKYLIDNQKALFAIIIPQNFQKNIISKIGTEVQFILDGRKTNSSQIFSSYANKILQTFQLEIANTSPKIQIDTRNWFNPNLEYQWYISITLTAILAMITALIITALSLAQEKEFGTFDQTIVSPLQPTEILIGKTIPAIVFALVVTGIMIIAGVVIFGVPVISPIWLIFLVTTIFLLSISGVGLFISSMCKSQQQAILGVFAFMVPSLLISGFVSPIEQMPIFMKFIGYINPVTYYILLMKGLFLKSIPYYLVIKYSIPLIAISFFTLTFAGWFFKKRLD